MIKSAKTLKLLSDPTRLRILMLLTKKELCVCQIMGILGISQPLVSRNLNLLYGAGFLKERKDGKLVFYSIEEKMDPVKRRLLAVLKEALGSDRILAVDLQSLDDCEKFQRKTGKCDMRTFSEFMKKRRKGVKR
jgi:ArsR family transcriptional regulator